MLASKGFEVKKIETGRQIEPVKMSDRNGGREQELNRFLRSLDQMIKDLASNKSQADSQLDVLE